MTKMEENIKRKSNDLMSAYHSLQEDICVSTLQLKVVDGKLEQSFHNGSSDDAQPCNSTSTTNRHRHL